MKGAVISDIHIKNKGDKSYGLLLSFLSKKEVLESSTWYFLGDIFDLMVGNHKEYLKTFPEFFAIISDFLSSGGSIHYLEGNHDFHLKEFFDKFLTDKNISKANFHYHFQAFEQNVDGLKFYFCHGDDLQTGDFGYTFLKYFLRNPISGFIINKLMSFSLLQKIGKLMSGNSRKYGQADEKLVKEKFRNFARQFLKKNQYDFLICGHSHVLDDYNFEGQRFINIGFPPLSNKYLLLDGGTAQFMSLN